MQHYIMNVSKSQRVSLINAKTHWVRINDPFSQKSCLTSWSTSDQDFISCIVSVLVTVTVVVYKYVSTRVCVCVCVSVCD